MDKAKMGVIKARSNISVLIEALEGKSSWKDDYAIEFRNRIRHGETFDRNQIPSHLISDAFDFIMNTNREMHNEMWSLKLKAQELGVDTVDMTKSMLDIIHELEIRITEAQAQFELQGELENQDAIENKIERLNDDNLMSHIAENRLAGNTSVWLKTCEVELAKRILSGQMTTPPEGFEDLFKEFQIAVEHELAKENQVSIENQENNEEK